MGFAIKTTREQDDAAGFLASSITRELLQGKRVLFFVPGGSAIPVVLKTVDILRESQSENLQNLTVTLTDERYGEIDHPDSNWYQLKEKGFDLPNAKLIYVLTGDDLETTARKWSETLEQELKTSAPVVLA